MSETGSELQMAADIVAAFVSRNSVPSSELPEILTTVHASLRRLSLGQTAEPASEPKPEPAVPIKKSVTPEFVICLEDGRKFKSLRRHLSSAYQMTPEAYRARWSLPSDYPMVAPNYAKTRSELAKKAGLGHKRPPAPKKKGAKAAA